MLVACDLTLVEDNDDEEVEVGGVVGGVVDVETGDEVEIWAPLVVIPSKACAQTIVPSEPAVIGTTVSPPVVSKEVTSINALAPIYNEQAAPAPGRLGSS